MKIRYATISKEGRRSNNEDFFVVMNQQERGRFWGIVCDGMGGHACGEVASETVAHAISAYWEQHAEERDSEAKVVEACQEATRAIEQKAREVGLAEMGTTMVIWVYCCPVWLLAAIPIVAWMLPGGTNSALMLTRAFSSSRTRRRGRWVCATVTECW